MMTVWQCALLLGGIASRHNTRPVQNGSAGRNDDTGTVRDMGPIFLRQRDGTLAVLDADWNYYGDHENLVGSSAEMLAQQDSFPTMIARRLWPSVVHSNLVIEGGAVEVNGAGILLQVEAVTMQRNPRLVQRQHGARIQAHLRRAGNYLAEGWPRG
ncbi:MAG: agmatine deiminase family protein [Flavobacteriales bacterium]|nr:agmatine deiminase family protein [Flavobacteriales bacterium]